ncbi:uncharacterized protein KGF55_000467 [Candida pseudojiufengensis]|uniref:uncharacterized protein n=1 Tax=Candida pseudojiufengensis TaxID=497109 RepID=UPI00222488CE|nr:uncharacterized protein KGF55_000467 [Candida pseudojiufengensis]KAI5966158.1 hypothetical protein KGF55_000467 [Candida pseudojiufengensis]
MEIETHPRIPKHVLKQLVVDLKTIDSLIELHFINHTINPSLSDVLKKASSENSRQLSVTDIEQINGILPIYELHKNEVLGDITINFTKDYTSSRIEKFTKSLNEWSNSNQCSTKLPRLDLGKSTISDNQKQTMKVLKPKSKQISTRTKFKDLRNDKSKFIYKEKTESTQSTKGLTLLERIKLKEKTANKENSELAKVQKYQSYLIGKVNTIYDIIYQFYKLQIMHSDINLVSVSLNQLLSSIKNSLNMPLTEIEIMDVLNIIESNLNNKFTSLVRNDIKILRIQSLSRENDLKVFEEMIRRRSNFDSIDSLQTSH